MSETEKPARPILRLKFPPKLPDPPAPAPVKASPIARPAAKAAPEAVFAWKCRPCGTGFNVAAALADDESVRCPSCNARLGLAADFRGDPPNLAKLRARAIAPGDSR